MRYTYAQTRNTFMSQADAKASQGIDQNSFMKSLFFGNIREDIVFPYPRVGAETTENISMILDSLQKFARDHVKSQEWDLAGAMPQEIIARMAELGVMGLAVPEDLGGLGLPQSGYARVMQEMASIDGALAQFSNFFSLQIIGVCL
jgi:acyl-CoA dehydrogenase family protein 9